MAHHMERSFVHCFQIKLEFRSVGSNGGRKTGELRKKNRWNKARTNYKLNPIMMLGPGVQPEPHWWEVSALTTASFLLPEMGSRAQPV